MGSSSPLFREIHKNTWLKRLTAEGKKVTVGPKRSDKSWVVFCVHDDSEALLEGYIEPRHAPSHLPEWKISLQMIQHISHALVSSENEFEFVITLTNEVVRLQAISWEIMKEWVDTLRQKLREMKLLSPKENLYTKLPEFRAPLLPTRDPTSPLPNIPPVPAAIVPGIEATINRTSINLSEVTIDFNEECLQPSSTSSSSSSSSSLDEQLTNVLKITPNRRNLVAVNSIRVDVSLESDTISLREGAVGCDSEGNTISRKGSNANQIGLTNSSETDTNRDPLDASSTTNITIIQVSNPLDTDSQQENNESCKFSTAASTSASRMCEEYKSNVQIIPSYNGNTNGNATKVTTNDNNGNSKVTKVNVASDNSSESPDSAKTIILSSGIGITNIAINDVEPKQQPSIATVSIIPSNNVDSHYDKVFLATNTHYPSEPIIQITKKSPLRCLNSVESTPIPSTSRGGAINEEQQISPTKKLKKPTSNSSSQQLRKSTFNRENISPSVPIIPKPSTRPVLTRGFTEAVITCRPSRIDMIRKNNVNLNKMSSNSTRPNTYTPVQIRSESLDHQRQRSSSTSEVQARGPRPQRHNHVVDNTPAAHNVSMSPQKRVTLREQQVNLLRREIMHSGGVRLQLRRKNCLGTIGWVDALGAVWVAGWKQKEHPVLYNAFHIGDQLLSIAGVNISSASEANKVIRNTNTLFVEILVRRVPFGRAYAIRREREGQCLGFLRDEKNPATIVEVIPNSLAAKNGVSPMTKSCDGSTMTFWVLTEINNRPINLFFKDTEIRERLNSIGRDISILIQPSDLITKLKKQLKSIRGYKDFIVQ